MTNESNADQFDQQESLELHLVRQLTVRIPSGEADVSAASGIVRAGQQFFVVADDELSLAVFPRGDNRMPGERVALLEGSLPEQPAERKRAKPDFEALVRLPASVVPPGGAILAIPSGSTPLRITGALMKLSADGAIGQPAEPVDLGGLYAELGKSFDELNIEGAVMLDGWLRLFQRGNGEARQNGTIDLDLAVFATELANRTISSRSIARTMRHDLGDVRGVPLSFTDAAGLSDGRTLFLAVAERTEDTYADGPFEGAVVGLMDADQRVTRRWRLAVAEKPEGLLVEEGADGLKINVVTDADDPRKAAKMYEGFIPLAE